MKKIPRLFVLIFVLQCYSRNKKIEINSNTNFLNYLDLTVNKLWMIVSLESENVQKGFLIKFNNKIFTNSNNKNYFNN